MPLRFGTDGVRGVANAGLTPELALALGRAAAGVFGSRRFLVGRDTRISGPMLQSALAAGLAAEGADVVDLGVLPTPGLAWFSAADGVPAAVISASHNPMPDNGIKFFAAGGRKLDDDTEAALEAALDRLVGGPAGGDPAGGDPGAGDSRAREAAPTGAGLGRIAPHRSPHRYAAALASSLEGRRLDGLQIVADCANGAAWEVAPEVLTGLGCQLQLINARPDGVNINEACGSTHPDALSEAVVEAGADAGLAFDGDADRVIAVDHHGRVVDGDQIIAACALDRRQRGLLPDHTVVVTVMSNLGFRHAMAAHGIRVVETKVGDRHVLEAMERGGWTLGGEQSGHVIFRDLATTGDGLLTAVQLLDVVVRSGRPLAAHAEVMTRLPQVLRNVATPEPRRAHRLPGVEAELARISAELGDRGRILVRPSGTEPVVRVMVEAPTAEEADSVCQAVCGLLERALGEPSQLAAP